MVVSSREVHITIIHTNDIYEIQPVSGGELGGLSRLTTLKKQLLAQNPNTFLVLAGDYHGPSGLGLAKHEGTPLAGKQMVAVLNKVGIDFATYGDHEFNVYNIEAHLARHSETQFLVISSNILNAQGAPFAHFKINHIFEAKNEQGDTVKVGLFGVTEHLGAEYAQVKYFDPFEVAAQQVAELKDKTDILIALTHHEVADDRKLAAAQPDIDLILGGDEHEHMHIEPGEGLAPIFKSDSNARNVQIIDLYYDLDSAALRIESRLQAITSAIPDDPEIQKLANEWTEIAQQGFKADGIDISEEITRYHEDLDGFSTAVRNKPTALSMAIVNAVHARAVEPDFSVMTGGLIRLDDMIPAGRPFTMYEVLRTYPTDMHVVTVKMSGDKVVAMLNQGKKAAGSSYYLVSTANVTQAADGTWLFNGAPFEPTRVYRIGMAPIELYAYRKLMPEVVEEHKDYTLRKALIDGLRKGNH